MSFPASTRRILNWRDGEIRPEEELNEIVLSLANDIPLPAKNQDYTLKGEYSGCRECHIQPDWLLIYSKESDGELHILNLIRTGTHSDLFKK